MTTALITGVTGQDGAYLARLLLAKGYEVHGIKRRSSMFNTQRVDGIYTDPHELHPRFFLHYGDLTDATNLIRIVQETQPDEIYNLAAQSHVQVSFETPEYTGNADALGTLRLLEALRILSMEKRVKFYQASTSELYGKVQAVPQSETTPFYPRSPYAVAKLYGYWIVTNYREAYGIHASNGILFNHESPIRGETFVTRKITMAAARIREGLQDKLYLGNLDAQRDWGFAGDYVEGMWRILQAPEPGDYVLATGEMHTVREFCQLSFARLGLDLEFRGSGVDEVGVDAKTGRELIAVDPRYFRPAEVDLLVGDARKAKELLGWTPRVTFNALVEMMVDADLKAVQTNQPFVAEFSFRGIRRDGIVKGPTRRIFVAGHRGLVGSALVRALGRHGYPAPIVRTRTELDLRDGAAVRKWMEEVRPDTILLAAAKVGGIHANNTARWDFLYENLQIETSVIGAAVETGVSRLVFLGSSCIYPKHASQPIHEDALLTGALEPTNEPYAIAKIAGLKLVEAAVTQFGAQWLSLMPTNLYGPGDNFDLLHSHVLPAMIRKYHDAKLARQAGETSCVELWGSGSPRREFLHVDDLAEATISMMDQTSVGLMNVGAGNDVTIRELADIVRDVVGYDGDVVWDETKPDGTPRKLLNSDRILATGWRPNISLPDGVRDTYAWYVRQYPSASLSVARH